MMDYDIDEKQTSIDNMSATLFDVMMQHANNGRNFDAIAIYEEWVVDSKDPENGEYEFLFLDNFTLID
jgi:hypothetical protein